MLYLRSLIFLVLQITSTVVTFFIPIICVFASSVTRGRLTSIWARINLFMLRYICGLRYRVDDRSGGLPSTPSIIAANHQSAWETLAFQEIFPVQSYILKRELLWIPLFGWGLAANRPIVINRADKKRALNTLIRESQIRLDEGRWLVVFPEGTRLAPDADEPFQVGAAMMACKTGACIVPVAHNAGVFWPKRGFLKYPGVIDVVIGPAIDPAGKKPRAVNEELEQWVKTTQATLAKTR